METIQFTITINADTHKVWHTMLDDATYRQWTSAFHEGSFYEGTWNKGSEIRFVSLDENGKQEGMFSRIKENIPYKFISITNLGIIKKGVIDTESDEAKKIAPSLENYTFTDMHTHTELKVEMEVHAHNKKMFEDMWPNSLQALKALCES